MIDATATSQSAPEAFELSETLAVDSSSTAPAPLEYTLALKPGDLVEVRSAEEILSSLDSNGKLDGLPFMPEMLAYCGRRLRVSRRADNTCALGQPRRIEATVHLEQLRCDGCAHRGCEAACLILWKEAWLRRATHDTAGLTSQVSTDANNAFRLLSDLAQRPDNTLMCQATELNSASCPVSHGSAPAFVGRIARDYANGKRTSADFRRLVTYFWGKAILFAFMLWARAPWNSHKYKKTPARALDLKPGDIVRVRSMFEILRTLDRKGCNRGMEFKPEMFRYCGRTFPVIANLERRIDERSGELRAFRTPCIVLQSVYCDGQRSFCQRSNYHYWREIWLSRV